MRYTLGMQTQSQVCSHRMGLEQGFTRMISCALAATEEFQKTGKGLITHTCVERALLLHLLLVD